MVTVKFNQLKEGQKFRFVTDPKSITRTAQQIGSTEIYAPILGSNTIGHSKAGGEEVYLKSNQNVILILTPIEEKLLVEAKKVYPIYGAEKEVSSNKTGRYIIKRQEYIENPISNPEELTGKLLWYTTEGGYDYNHPHSRAKERALKIVDAFNKSEFQKDLESTAPEMYSLLNEIKEGLEDKSERSIFEDSILTSINSCFQKIK